MVSLSDYSLPIKTPERNFPPVREEHFVGPEDFKNGDSEGTTETDSKTNSKGSRGYTRINKMKGRAI